VTGLAAALAGVAVAVLAWGWFEAGWLRKRVLEVQLDGLPPELDGLRVAHLSDFHLGVPSRGRRAVRAAVAWTVERRPDLVCVTGDLVSRRAGMLELEGHLHALGALGSCFVVLGNHDFAHSRDPFSEPVDLAAIAEIEGVSLLTDGSIDTSVRGCRVQVVGVDPRTYAARDARPADVTDESADARILLCHFPGIARRLPAGAFDLVLSGHMHAGQIVVPYPGGRLRLAHPRAQAVEGLYSHGSTTLHVSPGLGTTFVPFRFFARPEVTELVLRSGGGPEPAVRGSERLETSLYDRLDGEPAGRLDGRARAVRG
jgi:predicted MPP superfamily phosphohydrolase